MYTTFPLHHTQVPTHSLHKKLLDQSTLHVFDDSEENSPTATMHDNGKRKLTEA